MTSGCGTTLIANFITHSSQVAKNNTIWQSFGNDLWEKEAEV